MISSAVVLEHVSLLRTIERIPVGEEVPAVYRWLEHDPARAIAEVPVGGEGLVRKETLNMYFSLYHLKPTVQGFVGYPPLLSHLLRSFLDEFPSELSL